MNIQDKVKGLMARIGIIELFVSAKSMAKSNTPEMLKVCEQLLDEDDIESSVRAGDIFALMIETQYALGNITKSKDLLRLMQTRVPSTSLDYYLVILNL
jgi:intraflagellar transport protein 140